MNKPPAELLAEIGEGDGAPPPDKLDLIRSLARRARDNDLRITELIDALDGLKSEQWRLIGDNLPKVMDEAGVPSISLAAEGNAPAIKITCRQEIKANIAASWPVDKREDAFDWLEENGYGDLIKKTVTVKFGRHQSQKAMDLVADLADKGFEVEVNDAVPHTTLSSWLREVWSKGVRPPLDVLGGFVGRVAKIERVKL